MSKLEELLLENDIETNKTVSKAMRFVFYFYIIAEFLNLIHVFSVEQNIMINMIILLTFPLLIPTILIDILNIRKAWVKYIILTCAVISTGIGYAILTFQTILMFIIPTILASMYFRKKELIFVIVESVCNILGAHLFSCYFLIQPWIEPFQGLKNIMLYGAIPRVLEYLCLAVLFYILCSRTSKLTFQYYKSISDKAVFEIQKSIALQKIKYEEREQISRDIHNSVGHTIMASIMSLEAAEAVYDTDSKKSMEKVRFANIRMRESLEAIRKAVRGINNDADEHTIEDMLSLIEVNIDKLKMDFNLKIRTKIICSRQTLRKQAISIKHIDFWIGALQELVTNSVKHGNGTAIIVIINIYENSIHMLVQDNGTGIKNMDNLKKLLDNGFGIRKIKEYLISAGGNFNMENQEGLMVELEMPIKAGDKDE